MRRFTSLFASLVVCAACGSTDHPPPSDGGPVTDSGSPGTDAGMDVDGGTPPVDAGSPGTDAGMGCDSCPSGTTCGTANGIAVCRSAEGIPQFTHVFVIVMENTSLATLSASTNTPYIHSLVASYASSTNYHGVAHPSLPNYIAMTSGADVSGIGCDCQATGSACSALTCNAFLGSCGCPQSVMHIGDQLEAAGKSWKNYAEDLGSPCNVMDHGNFAARHVPFLYYPNVQTDAARCAAHVVEYTTFAGDLGDEAPAYSLISPNLVDDMHGSLTTPSATNLANGEAWLSAQVPPILASGNYTNGGLLVIVWDEDDLSGTIAPDDPIEMILLSPYAKSGGFASSVHADHASLLATIEEGLGLPRLGSAASASPLADFFPAD